MGKTKQTVITTTVRKRKKKKKKGYKTCPCCKGKGIIKA